MSKTKLEKIADDLISGRINSCEAKSLTTGLKLPSRGNVSKNFGKIREEGNLIVLVDDDENQLGDISFRFERDNAGTKYAWMELAHSYNEGAGNFSRLFNYFSELVQKNNAEYIKLEVDSGHSRAVEIYNHLNFYPLDSDHECSTNPDMFLMRKDF